MPSLPKKSNFKKNFLTKFLKNDTLLIRAKDSPAQWDSCFCGISIKEAVILHISVCMGRKENYLSKGRLKKGVFL
jgi:hypothetical protein